MAFIAQHCDFSAVSSFLSAFPTLLTAGVLLGAVSWVVGNIVSFSLELMRG